METLLQKIHVGDENGFKEFYHLQFFKLYQFAFSFVRSRESSEELVNDVFLAFWQKRSSVPEIVNIQVYLYVSVKNACLNYLRRNRLPEPLSIDELCVDHFSLVADPEVLLTRRELQHQIRDAIEQLPPRCRFIFKLVKIDGLTYREASLVLDISVKTVDSQLRLALKKLAGILQAVTST